MQKRASVISTYPRKALRRSAVVIILILCCETHTSMMFSHESVL